MLTLVVHLPVVMAAEKSRTAFYIVGGLTAVWAVFISLGVGLRRPEFPSNAGGQRMVMAISAVLVIATAATGVITASRPSKPASPASAHSSGAASTGRGLVASSAVASSR